MDVKTKPAVPYSIFLLNLFSTISYAVAYSSLELFLSMRHHVTEAHAMTVMGVFLALNSLLHFLGGYIGGRLISYRSLFFVGSITQALGCVLLITPQANAHLFLYLSVFLMGTGVTSPCINMMLTQRFKDNALQREKAFLWNYAGMNIGFLIGFLISSYFQADINFHDMFAYALFGNLLAAFTVSLNWHKFKDHATPLSKKPVNAIFFLKLFCALIILIIGLIATKEVIAKATLAQDSILIFAFCVFMSLLIYAIKHHKKPQGKKAFAFILLAIANIGFWSIYMLMPTGMIFFIKHHVNNQLGHFHISPQAFSVVNAFIIIVFGLVMPRAFRAMRKRITFDIPIQFATSLFMMAAGLLTIILGQYFHEAHGQVAIIWVFFSYIIQSIAELLIAPVGAAMIGTLAKSHMQGFMMGFWLMLAGLADIISGKVSSLAGYADHLNNINASHFINLFYHLSSMAILISITLILLRHPVRRLINAR